ncbi:MAG: LysR substrate-binding domain-containing protein [Blautia sp.]|jgi:DNA-binding transcriptional LysR family regulator
MVVDNTQHLLAALNQGELDFAVVEGYFKKSEFESRLWTLEPYICICAGNHVLSQEEPALEDMFEERLIMRNPGSGSREVLERVLEEHNCHLTDFHHVVEISDIHVIKELVKEDCGISFLYRKAVEKELEEGSIRQVTLKNFQVSHEFNFLWRKGSIFSEEFHMIFQELCGEDTQES